MSMMLDAWLAKTGKSEAQLAEIAGVHRSSINRIRRGSRHIGLGLALRIERATGGSVTAEELLLSGPARDSLTAFRGAA